MILIKSSVSFSGMQKNTLPLEHDYHRAKSSYYKKIDYSVLETRIMTFCNCGKRHLRKNACDYISDKFGLGAVKKAQKMIEQGKNRFEIMKFLTYFKSAGKNINKRF